MTKTNAQSLRRDMSRVVRERKLYASDGDEKRRRVLKKRLGYIIVLMHVTNYLNSSLRLSRCV